MRPRDTLTPEQERELEALDRALLGEPVELELRELEALVNDIRATAPEMSPAFAARLDDEVSEGFPAPRERPARVRRVRRPWILLPALGSLAAVLVALVVVLGSDGNDSLSTFAENDTPAPRERTAESAGAGAGAAADQAAAPATAGAPAPAASPARRSAPVPPPPAAALDTSRAPRKIERSASLALETPAGDFDRTVADVQARVASFGGIVANAQIGESDAAGGEATFDLRIPTDRLDRALAALAKLGDVTERTQSMTDITSSFSSAQERLSDARAERRGLLRALGRATSQAQIDSLKAQLRSVGSRIAAIKGELSSLRRRADLATVTLSVRGTGERGVTGGGGQWTPGDAAGDAVRVLEVVAGVALIALAVLVPAALLGAAIALGVRLGRRRRREAALDPA